MQFYCELLFLGHLSYHLMNVFVSLAEAFFRPLVFISAVARSTCKLDSLVTMAFVLWYFKAFLANSGVKLLPTLLACINCNKSILTIYLSAVACGCKGLAAEKSQGINFFEWFKLLFELLLNLPSLQRILFVVFRKQVGFDKAIQLGEGLIRVLFQPQQEFLLIFASVLHDKNDTINTIHTCSDINADINKLAMKSFCSARRAGIIIYFIAIKTDNAGARREEAGEDIACQQRPEASQPWARTLTR